MFPAMAHSVFDQHIKLEPINFYGQPSTPEVENTVQQFSKESGKGTSTASSRPKPQECKICGKVLSSPSSYYVHLKLHSGSKPFQCTQCDASFCRKPYLEVHMRTHTGERPFKCDVCLKRFTQKSSLNTHKRVHSGERPYQCDLCSKQFAVKSYLMAHRWSHVADRPLACPRCSEAFTSKAQFAAHSRAHNSERFDCGVCGRSFVKDSFLIRHQTRVHGIRGGNSATDVNEFVVVEELRDGGIDAKSLNDCL